MSEPPTGELSDDKQPLDVWSIVGLGFEFASQLLDPAMGSVEARSAQGVELLAPLPQLQRALETGLAALELWERGEKLYALCTARLDAAHGRVEELTRELEAQADDAPDGAEAPELEADTGRER